VGLQDIAEAVDHWINANNALQTLPVQISGARRESMSKVQKLIKKLCGRDKVNPRPYPKP
jgi:hypothetical protein